MSTDAATAIEQLRRYMGAETDAELAKKLRIDKSTISSWRSRESVPGRYLRILDGSSHFSSDTAPIGWGEHEIFAFRLALFRFTRARAELVQSDDYNILLPTFSFSGGFFRLMSRSQRDLAAKKEESGVDLATAFALVLHEDIQGEAESVARDRATLRTDDPTGEEAG